MLRLVAFALTGLALFGQDAPKPDELTQLRAQVTQQTATITYLRKKADLANSRAELLQFVYDEFAKCIQKDGVPTWNTVGDPVCGERPKPAVTPATAPVRTTP